MPKAPIIGFFHPECDGGAGGEKVLYQAIKAIQESKYNDLNILIYSGSDKKTIGNHQTCKGPVWNVYKPN